VLCRELGKVSRFYSHAEEELEAAMEAFSGAPNAGTHLSNLRSEALDLRKYAALNYIAVVKAVKKRNRHLKMACGSSCRALKAFDVLRHQHFFTSPRLAALQTRAEILFKVMEPLRCAGCTCQAC
jgi:RNA polymerase II subunit A small phosphatase-like protein